MTLVAVSLPTFVPSDTCCIEGIFLILQREHGEPQVASLNLADLQDGQHFPSQLGWNIVFIPVLMVEPAGFWVF